MPVGRAKEKEGIKSKEKKKGGKRKRGGRAGIHLLSEKLQDSYGRLLSAKYESRGRIMAFTRLHLQTLK